MPDTNCPVCGCELQMSHGDDGNLLVCAGCKKVFRIKSSQRLDESKAISRDELSAYADVSGEKKAIAPACTCPVCKQQLVAVGFPEEKKFLCSKCKKYYRLKFKPELSETWVTNRKALLSEMDRVEAAEFQRKIGSHVPTAMKVFKDETRELFKYEISSLACMDILLENPGAEPPLLDRISFYFGILVGEYIRINVGGLWSHQDNEICVDVDRHRAFVVRWVKDRSCGGDKIAGTFTKFCTFVRSERPKSR